MEQSIDNHKGDNTNVTLMNYKDEERKLSESLYRNLHVMQRFHEATADFRQIFEPHMFIKSNPKAFPLVIHFIFNCLDAVEFNKRFLWPIFDKASETRFRKSTLDYMNHLNVTHRLGLETLKLSNIHIPGGLKFIKIIHKFTYLIMKEEVKKRELGSLPNLHEIPDANEQLANLEKLLDHGMDFVTKIQIQSDKLVERIEAMNALMASFFEGSVSVVKEDPCWSCLAKEWRDELDIVATHEVTTQLERINVFSKQSTELNELLTKLFVDRKENIVQYDEGQLVIVQNFLKQMNPDLERAIDGIIEGPFINLENLFHVFSFMLPKMVKKIELFKYRDLEAIQFEYDEVATLNVKASNLQAEAHAFEKALEPFIKRDEEKFRKFRSNNVKLPFCIMHTPPITRRCQINRMRNRFALMDENTNQTKMFKEPSVKRTTFKNATLSKSILSTSSKHLHSQNAALDIISKSKSRGNSYQTLNNVSTLSKFSTPKFSSTMCAATVGTTKKKSQTELKFSSMYPMTPTHVFAENVLETTSVTTSPSAVTVTRKVSTNSVYHFNTSNGLPHATSPTRHFQAADIPSSISRVIPRSLITGTADPNEHRNESNENAEVEYAVAVMNSPPDELIGNVSDTVLNDVSFN